MANAFGEGSGVTHNFGIGIPIRRLRSPTYGAEPRENLRVLRLAERLRLRGHERDLFGEKAAEEVHSHGQDQAIRQVIFAGYGATASMRIALSMPSSRVVFIPFMWRLTGVLSRFYAD